MKRLCIILMLAVAACGGSDASNTGGGNTGGNTTFDPRTNFLGTWSLSGTLTVSLGIYGTDTEPTTGNITIIRGAQSSQIVAPYGECNVPATVSGNTASVPNGYNCTLHYVDGTATLTYRTGNFVLNGNVITFMASGDVMFQFQATGLSYSGQFVQDGQYSLVGR